MLPADGLSCGMVLGTEASSGMYAAAGPPVCKVQRWAGASGGLASNTDRQIRV
jgi:hypothetical protein